MQFWLSRMRRTDASFDPGPGVGAGFVTQYVAAHAGLANAVHTKMPKCERLIFPPIFISIGGVGGCWRCCDELVTGLGARTTSGRWIRIDVGNRPSRRQPIDVSSPNPFAPSEVEGPCLAQPRSGRRCPAPKAAAHCAGARPPRLQHRHPQSAQNLIVQLRL